MCKLLKKCGKSCVKYVFIDLYTKKRVKDLIFNSFFVAGPRIELGTS